MRPHLDELLDLALEVAGEAGDLLVRGREGTVEADATKSSATDVVTAMDRASEDLVGRRLRAARPDDGLLGEEDADYPGTSGVRWVVDPLDGTVNYLYRLPNWAVSLAAEWHGEVVVGVVHAPALGVTYSAVRGGGAWLGERRLRVSHQTDLSQALVGTGFSYLADRRGRQAEVLARVLPQVRDIRRYGSAALDLCAVGEGRLDAYFEQSLNPWDLAAGGLVATEAGAVVGGLHDRPPGPDLVVAAPPALWTPLTALLAQDPPADRP